MMVSLKVTVLSTLNIFYLNYSFKQICEIDYLYFTNEPHKGNQMVKRNKSPCHASHGQGAGIGPGQSDSEALASTLGSAAFLSCQEFLQQQAQQRHESNFL